LFDEVRAACLPNHSFQSGDAKTLVFLSGDILQDRCDREHAPASAVTLDVVATTGSVTHQGKPSFHIQKREAIGTGFARAIGEQLRAASDQLQSSGKAIGEAVHEARKALKKSRALLRLIGPALGDEYAALNVKLRDAGRSLSALRDAEALAETAQRLRQQSHKKAATQVLDEAHRRLVEQKRHILNQLQESGELAKLAHDLEELAGRVTGLSLRRVNPSMIAEGVAETVRRGRKAFGVAQKSRDSGDFHEWRKRAKDLRYQVSFLRRLWPHVFEGYAESARELEQSLGEDHNLSVLRGIVAADSAKAGPLLAILDAEQQRLRGEAERIGRLLYSEKPKHWAKRIACAWDRR
jgi:CHAD domain-containing protein